MRSVWPGAFMALAAGLAGVGTTRAFVEQSLQVDAQDLVTRRAREGARKDSV